MDSCIYETLYVVLIQHTKQKSRVDSQKIFKEETEFIIMENHQLTKIGRNNRKKNPSNKKTNNKAVGQPYISINNHTKSTNQKVHKC